MYIHDVTCHVLYVRFVQQCMILYYVIIYSGRSSSPSSAVAGVYMSSSTAVTCDTCTGEKFLKLNFPEKLLAVCRNLRKAYKT